MEKMKNFIVLYLVTALCMFSVPFCTVKLLEGSSRYGELHTAKENYERGDYTTISVYLADEQKAVTMDFREYIIGVVAAEMPVVFHSEALSAGAVCAATLARKNQMSGKSDELSGAVISTDSTKHQAFMNTDEMKKRWEDKFPEYYKKLCDAVDKAIDYSITYEGELITAAYHAVSPGKTENSGNVWTASIPYLVSVDSPGDSLSPKYADQVKLTSEEFMRCLEKKCTMSEDKSSWFSEEKYSDAGTLLKIKIGNKIFTGEELRDIFSLRSACITFNITDEGVLIETKGYGHGVGLSQYGADYLARQGYSWQEIITHYYTGVSIEKI